MAPTFHEGSFVFEKDEQVPAHIEDVPSLAGHDPTKWWLKGVDVFAYEDYVVAINVDDVEVACILARARRRELERTQPTATSGGQGFDGIQDRVEIMPPGSKLDLRG